MKKIFFIVLQEEKSKTGLSRLDRVIQMVLLELNTS